MDKKKLIMKHKISLLKKLINTDVSYLLDAQINRLWWRSGSIGYKMGMKKNQKKKTIIVQTEKWVKS